MQRIIFSAAAAALSLAALPQAALAYTSGVTVLKDDIVYDVNADGTFTQDEFETVRINNEGGLRQRAQLPIAYSTSLQDLQVLEAYTTTRDGKRIDVTPDKVLVQQSPQSAGAPMFDDGKVKVIVFPAAEVGATLTAHVRKLQKQALFPGHFSMLEAAATNIEFVSQRITLRAPASMLLHVDAVDMPGGRIPGERADQQVWQWTMQATEPRAPEANAVSELDRSPRVAVTTFADYDAAAKAYLDRAEPKAAVTPAIRELADQITKDVKDKRAQAEALYQWVSRNIRYVAIYLDFGGVVPHAAQSVLDARYGDCKDHVTLLEALLAAKGIKSSTVLVNADTSYWLPRVAIAPGVFNHVITYLPEFDTYVDSTAGTAMFGVLPVTELGKPALVTDDGTGRPKQVTLPIATPEQNTVAIETSLLLTDDGSIRGSSSVSNTGTFDWVTRQVFSNIPYGMERQAVGQVLAMTGQGGGTGSFSRGDARDLRKPFGYATTFELPAYTQMPGPGAFTIPVGFTSFSNISSALETFASETRESPMPYLNRHITENIRVQLPQGLTLAATPRPADLRDAFAHYTSTYQRDGNVLWVRRMLEVRLPGALLQPKDYAALHAFAKSVNRDLRTQVLYQ